MNLNDLQKSALELNALYEQLTTKRHGRAWTTEELALGFVGDVGDLAKLANRCGIDLEAEFVRNSRELSEHVTEELRA